MYQAKEILKVSVVTECRRNSRLSKRNSQVSQVGLEFRQAIFAIFERNKFSQWVLCLV